MSMTAPQHSTAPAWSAAIAGLLALLVALVAAPQASAVSWTFASDNGVGNQPRDLVVASFEPDPGDDFAVANSQDDEIEIQLSNGDGTFHEGDACGQGPTFPAEGGPVSLAPAAWTTNGVVSTGLVAAGVSFPVVTAFDDGGTGGCGFIEPFPTIVLDDPPYVPGSNGLTGVSTGDLDGDRNVDVVTSDFDRDRVFVTRTDTNAHFGTTVTYAVGDGPMASTLTDLNHDGQLDLAVANLNGGTVTIRLGLGNGTLGAALTTPGSMNQPNAVETGDFDGDSVVDLVVSWDGGVSLLRGNGDGTFRPPGTMDTDSGPAHASVADVNGDGRPDVLVAYQDTSGFVKVLLHRAIGGFSTVTVNDAHISAPQAVGAGDFRGNGSHDLAVVNNGQPGSVSVLLGVPEVTHPTAVGFGGQRVGSPSAARTITIGNPGSGTLAVSSVTLAGADADQFQLASQTCTAGVRPGGSCTAVVRFDPTGVGTKSAVLELADDAAGSPQTVALSGTGEIPTVDLRPSSLSFPGQNVGTHSATRTLTVTNAGAIALDVAAVELTGVDASQFHIESQTCTEHPVPVDGTCQAVVGFDPTSPGPKQAGLRLTDDAPAPGSTQTAALSGLATQPALTLGATALDFGGQDVATVGAVRTVTVTNTGDGPLEVSQVGIAGVNPSDFALRSDGCTAAPIAAGASCTVSVAFAPIVVGARAAVLRVASDAPGGPARAALSGVGLAPSVFAPPVPGPLVDPPPPAALPRATLSRRSLAFPRQRVGTRSRPRTLTVRNTGTAPLDVRGARLTGARRSSFRVDARGCRAPVAPRGTCRLRVTFRPKRAGTARARLRLIADGPAAPTVGLSGKAAARPGRAPRLRHR